MPLGTEQFLRNSPIIRGSLITRTKEAWIAAPILFKISIIFCCLMFIDELLTANPYSAYHSGTIVQGSDVLSDNFFISPAWLLLGSAVYCCRLANWKKAYDWALILTLLSLLVAAIAVGLLVERARTYSYDVFVLVLCYIAAREDASRSAKYNYSSEVLLRRILLFFIAIGLFMSITYPTTYGNLPTSLSRDTRGEVVVWQGLGIWLIVPCIAAGGLGEKRKTSWALILATCIIVGVYVLAYYRTHIAILGAIFILAIYFHLRRPLLRALFIIAFLLLLLIELGGLMDFFTLGVSNTDFLDSVDHERSYLWSHLWDSFVNHPFFGVGCFSTQRSYYTGFAVSEVGMLRWLGENGFIFTVLMSFIVVRGVWSAVLLIHWDTKSLNTLDLLCAFSLVAMFPVLVVAGFNRILSLEEFIMYYSMFYCWYRKNGEAVQHPTASSPGA